MSCRARLGVQISEIDSDYTKSLLAGIRDTCEERDVDLVIFSGRSFEWPYGFEYQHAAIYNQVHEGNVDALVLSSGTQCTFSSFEKHLAYVRGISGIPVVSVAVELPGVPSVVVDGTGGFRDVLDHLHDVHGCRRFALLCGPPDNPETSARLEIFNEFMAERGVAETDVLRFSGIFSVESGEVAVADQISATGSFPYDALVSMNDMMALGALKAFRRAGIGIPTDVVVTGFDNIPRSIFCHPTLTTVSQDLEAQGRIAADLAIRAMRGEAPPAVTRLGTQALFRQSCGCIDAEAVEQNVRAGMERIEIEDELYHLRQYLGHLHAVVTMDDLFSRLRDDLESFRMRSCAIVLYGSEIPCARGVRFGTPSRARLALAYDETRPSQESTPNVEFDPRERLFPEGTFSARQRTLVASALFHRDAQLGYIVYEPGELGASIYEVLCAQLSSKISSAYAFESKLRVEERLTVALRDLEGYNRRLSEISQKDDLTGLYNRRGFIAIGQQNIDLAIRMGKPGLVMFADLDGLKSINDTWGHDAGDRAIAGAADAIRRTFRGIDVVARLGGDEFAVVVVDSGGGCAEALRDRLAESVASWNAASGEEFSLGISVGFVGFSAEARNLERLLALADRELYTEKRQKRAGPQGPTATP